jgi:4-amino-4-deoxy-L-arabinose transferase-like glycosyltransferase
MQQQGNSSVKWMTWGFWASYGFVFSLICYKSFTVPITHDEAWTVLRYLDESAWDIMMYPDSWPNNHILNTLLAKASAGIFGVHDWSVRLPNLLFYWFFAVGVFRFLKLVCKDRMV